jgi:exosortase sorting signal-containing protein
MKCIKPLILLAVLFLTPYAYAQPPSCPCDTHQLQNGTSGNDIIELLCPGGELSEGVTFDLTAHIVRINSEDGYAYSVQIIPESTGCGITANGQADGIATSTEEAEVCRAGLIQRCGLTLVTPIPAISEWGMITTAVALGIIGLLITARRKKAAA